MRPDARIAVLFAVVTAGAALSGVLAALFVLGLGLVLAAAARLGPWRFAPLAGSIATFALVVPFAPGPAAVAIAKGLGVSVTVLVAVSMVRWDRFLAALQAAGLARSAVAFLAIVFSHLETTGRDAKRAVDALVLRGGFRGFRGLLASTPLVLARLLRRALERADRTAEALEVRGFAGRLPGLGPLRLGRADAALTAASVLSAAVAAATWSTWNP
jgi:energy-coupling factor transporter transmembrane protein EcfT